MTDADLFRAKVEWETDTTVTGTFKRDRLMLDSITDAELMKAKCLGVLYAERNNFSGPAALVMNQIIRTLEDIAP